ncbi:MAG: hypothetical protein LBL13_04300 [Bacteroidales bacterium]|jgi:hypothetical protein|nr:hypothetical protein [Bacteroidales bacterium]
MLSAIPIKDSDFDAMQELVFSFAMENVVKWELDPEWLIHVLLPKKEAWTKAWADYVDPNTRTPLITLTKSIARKEYELLFVPLVYSIETSKVISGSEKISMRITDAYRQSHLLPTPVFPPDYIIGNSIARCLVLYFFKHNEPTFYKARGVRGVELLWAVLDYPPTAKEELIHSQFNEYSPFFFQFDESERGKTFYTCFRWKGGLEENGPWSEIISAIIP